jgi:Adenosine deaminase
MTTNAILAEESPKVMPAQVSTIDDEQCWNAVVARDARRDGQFVFAVSSTGVYCRPSCAARRPRRENVQFFQVPEAAERAGYRACLRCRPKAMSGNAELDVVRAICRYIEQHLDEPLTLGRLGKEFKPEPVSSAETFQGCPRHHAAGVCGLVPITDAQAKSAGRRLRDARDV